MKVKTLLYLALPVVVLWTLYVILKPQRAAESPLPPDGRPALLAPERVTPASPAPMTSERATSQSPAATAPEPATSASQVAKAPEADQGRVVTSSPNTFDIVVRGGVLISEQAPLKVRKGDEVTLRITTDRADEFHLHGYNLHVHLSPDRIATLQFTAKLTGRFGYELHKSGLELGALEVYPR